MDTYFDVYAHPDYTIEALQVLSPSVLYIIHEQLSTFDIFMHNSTIEMRSKYKIDTEATYNSVRQMIKSMSSLYNYWSNDDMKHSVAKDLSFGSSKVESIFYKNKKS